MNADLQEPLSPSMKVGDSGVMETLPADQREEQREDQMINLDFY